MTTVQIPESLPARMFLPAYDTRKKKPTGRGRHLGWVLRAAALTELYRDGRLVEEKRRPVPGTPGLVAKPAGSSRPRS